MQIIAVTQARLGSSRFPNKVLKKIGSKSLLEIHLHRIKKCKIISELIVATTLETRDNEIELLSKKLEISCFRGLENDVLDRYYNAVKKKKPSYVVRITSDCPLVDPNLIDMIVNYTINNNLDYCSNTLEDSYPNGQDIEVFRFSALENAWLNAKLNSEREHVTPYIKKNSSYLGGSKFKSDNIKLENDIYSKVRITVDEPCDFEVVKALVQDLGIDSGWKEYSDLYLSSKKIHSLNSKIIRNEGYIKSLKNDFICE